MNIRLNPSIKRLLGHQITIAALIFALALGLRLIYLSSAVDVIPMRADAAKYATIAINLVDHGTYAHGDADVPTPDAFITPGYPLFLTAILSTTRNLESTYYSTRRAQAVLMAFASSIAFLLGSLFLPRWAALSGGLLTTFSPHMVTISGYLITEALFTFLLLLSLYLTALGSRKKSAALLSAGALAVGLGSLVRPSLLLFPIVIAFIILLDKRMLVGKRMKYAALIAVLVTVIWSPWSIWKADKESSVNNAAASFALGTYPNLTYRDAAFRGLPYKEDDAYDAMSKDIGVALKVMLNRAKEDPGKYVYWYLIGKPMTYWSWNTLFGQKGPFIYPAKSNSYFSNDFLKFTLSLYMAMHPIFVLLSLAAAMILLRELMRSRFNTAASTEAFFVVGCIAYFTVLHMVFAPLPRYSIPLHPLIYIAGLYSISKLLELKRQASRELVMDDANAN